MFKSEEHQSFVSSMLYLKIEADRLNMPFVAKNLKLAIMASIQELNEENAEEFNLFFDKLLSVPVKSLSDWKKLINNLEEHEKIIQNYANITKK